MNQTDDGSGDGNRKLNQSQSSFQSLNEGVSQKNTATGIEARLPLFLPSCWFTLERNSLPLPYSLSSL